MKSVTIKTCIVFGLCLTLPILACGQAKRDQSTTQSCRAFVEHFYTWYSSMALQHNRLTQPDVAVKVKPDLFSADLLQGLKEEANAQEKAGSDLVSLDGDPFVGGDGPADGYAAQKTTLKDGKCWVEVHGVREGSLGKSPEVTPELAFRTGRWVFINFYFPSASDPRAWNLLGQLKLNRELQQKYQTKADRK